MDRERAYLPCPGNNCGDPLAVTLERGLLGAVPEVGAVQARCQSCGTYIDRIPDWSPTERQAAWDEAQAHAELARTAPRESDDR
jgi:hypothetical protein